MMQIDKVNLEILPFYVYAASTDKVLDYFFWFVGGYATELWFVSGKE